MALFAIFMTSPSSTWISDSVTNIYKISVEIFVNDLITPKTKPRSCSQELRGLKIEAAIQSI